MQKISRNLFRENFYFFIFLGLLANFWGKPRFWPNIGQKSIFFGKSAKIGAKSFHKKPKNQIFQNPPCIFVDISKMLPQYPKWGFYRPLMLRKTDTVTDF